MSHNLMWALASDLGAFVVRRIPPHVSDASFQEDAVSFSDDIVVLTSAILFFFRSVDLKEILENLPACHRSAVIEPARFVHTYELLIVFDVRHGQPYLGRADPDVFACPRVSHWRW